MRAVLAAIVLLAAGCGGPDGTPRAEAAPVRTDAVPATIAGLTSVPEDVTSQLEAARGRSYVDDLRVWSLREGERLRATIQVARFQPDARTGSLTFQRSIVARMGASAPRERRNGRQRVYVTSANKQSLFAWFTDGSMIVLSASASYRTPGALLRAAIAEVRP